jgi:hypothetical protein
MATVTVTALVERARQMSNMVARDTVDDAEVASYINAANKRLYALLVRHGLVSDETLTELTSAGTAGVTLPTDFFALQAVYLPVNNYLVPLRRGEIDVRVQLATASTYVPGTPTTYRMVGSTIQCFPHLATGEKLWVHYIPDPTTLTTASSVNYPMGWEEYLAVDAAIQCLSKEETVNPVLNARMEKLERAIADEAAMREMRETHFVENRKNSPRPTDPADVWWGTGVRF